MVFKKVASGLLAVVVSICLPYSSSASYDEGYPEGVPAPYRTCPDSVTGDRIESEITHKFLVCTMIDGAKRWWLENEPLPLEPTALSVVPAPGSFPIEIHSYLLPSKVENSMKVYKDVSYSTISKSQKLDIYIPKNVKNPPLLIWFHGGAFMFLDKGVVRYDDGAKLLESMAKQGIAVASVDYRLASEAKYPAAGIDAKDAVRFLRANAKKYGFDSNRFIAGGESSGAYLAVMLGATGDQKSIFDNIDGKYFKSSSQVAGVVEVSGSADFVSMKKSIALHPCKANIGNNVVLVDNPWFGSESIPEVKMQVTNANMIPYIKSNSKLPKFFIIHGSEDCFVSSFEAYSLAKVTRSNSVKPYVKIVTEAGHGSSSLMAEVNKLGTAFKLLKNR